MNLYTTNSVQLQYNKIILESDFNTVKTPP